MRGRKDHHAIRAPLVLLHYCHHAVDPPNLSLHGERLSHSVLKRTQLTPGTKVRRRYTGALVNFGLTDHSNTRGVCDCQTGGDPKPVSKE